MINYEKYTTEIVVDRETFNSYGEFIFRQFVEKIIHSMDVEDLKTLFKIQIIHPETAPVEDHEFPIDERFVKLAREGNVKLESEFKVARYKYPDEPKNDVERTLMRNLIEKYDEKHYTVGAGNFVVHTSKAGAMHYKLEQHRYIFPITADEFIKKYG